MSGRQTPLGFIDTCRSTPNYATQSADIPEPEKM
jgi:hypothetical protein